jgi:hypothetical protein
MSESLALADWADLARRSDVEHETGLLRAEFGTLRAEMAGEFAAVRAEMAGEFAAVRAEFRGEIQRAMASQTRWLATLMVSAMLGLGALFSTVTLLAQ